MRERGKFIEENLICICIREREKMKNLELIFSRKMNIFIQSNTKFSRRQISFHCSFHREFANKLIKKYPVLCGAIASRAKA